MNTKAVLGARYLLGLIFVVFGLNFFFHFIPNQPMPEAAGKFAGAMFETGYMFTLVKVTEVVVGVLLLSGFFVPLALILLAPITVNIVFFHAFLAPAGLMLPVVVLILHLGLAWHYRAKYVTVLQAK